MQFHHPDISKIVKDINTLKTLKELHDFMGGQPRVSVKSFQGYMNVNYDVFVDRMNELQHRGYIKLVHDEQENVFVKMTDDGKTVCGFVMSTLVRFYDSQR